MKRHLPIVILLIVALLATGYTRQLAASRRGTGRELAGSSSDSSPQLARMSSFALALLLGGLRGPLVMILWTSSETQKAEKDLQDFDTKVEWIRRLQPEFDSVHIFQIWNKAYNISVQKATLSNKYLTIIDAIDYGRSVDQDRPDDINIIYAIGSVFGDKLGDAQEKVYYQRHVRIDSLPHANPDIPIRSADGRLTRLPTVLDSQGRMLAEYLAPKRGVHLADPSNPADVYDGAELPFLKRFEPYPYGIDPHGFAYNYRKRAQLLERWGNQRHAQLSPNVVDSRPATDLRIWGESEWEHGRRLELTALGRAIPPDRITMEADSAQIPPNFVFNPDAVAQAKEAIFSYHLSQRLWKASDAEYVDYIRRNPQNLMNDQSQRDEMWARSELLRGDEEYLSMLLAAPADRAAHAVAARKAYDRAQQRFALLMLRYWMNPDAQAAVLPPGQPPIETLANWFAHADELPSAPIVAALDAGLRYMQTAQHIPVTDEVTEYRSYIHRAQVRMQQLPSN